MVDYSGAANAKSELKRVRQSYKELKEENGILLQKLTEESEKRKQLSANVQSKIAVIKSLKEKESEVKKREDEIDEEREFIHK